MTSRGVLAARAADQGARSAAPGDRVRSLVRRLDPAVVGIVVGGLVLRLWGLGSQSLWYDEWLTSEAVDGSLPDLFRHVADREGIPPAYFVAQWAWVQVAGDGELALRALSVLAGVATIPVAALVATRLGQGRRAARLAALFTAVNPMLVWYSQEARPYSLIAFVGALSLVPFVGLWRDGPGARRDLVAWAAVAACAVAIHYFAAFLIAAEGLALILRHRAAWRRLLLAAVPGAVVLALHVPVALRQHSHEINRLWISEFAVATRLEEAGRAALVGPSVPDDRLWLLVALVVVLAAVLLAVRAAPEARRAAGVLTGVAVASVVPPVVLAATGIADVVVGRYLIASLVPLVVAVAIGLAAGPRAVWVPAAGLVTVVSLAVVLSVARDPALARPYWSDVAAAATGGEDPDGGGDRVAVVLNVHRTVASPLQRYVEGSVPLADDATVPVDEIAVVHARPTSQPCNFLVGRACALLFLGAPLPPDLAAQVTPDERVVLDQFVVERYRVTDPPLEVTTADLVDPAQVGDALVLVPG